MFISPYLKPIFYNKFAKNTPLRDIKGQFRKFNIDRKRTKGEDVNIGGQGFKSSFILFFSFRMEGVGSELSLKIKVEKKKTL